MSSSRPSLRPALALALAGAVLSCGPVSRRDLGVIPQRQITYDDMCHLQTYFDQRASAHAPPFRALEEQSIETSRVEADERGQMRPVVLGEGTYAVRDRTDRVRLRQLLHDEYRRLPDVRLLGHESDVRVKVTWWRSGTVRRLVPDHDVEVVVDGSSFSFPFNPCVGEFLFGDEPYAMRRNVLAAERARAHGEIPAEYLHADAGDDAPGDSSPGDSALADAGVSDRPAVSDAVGHPGPEAR